MKRIFCVFLVLVGIFTAVFGMSGCGEKEKPLRLHIRANSNDAADQSVKLSVRDAVVEYLTPLLKNADSVESAKKIILKNSDKIADICEKTLENKGFFYGAELHIAEEYFPSRSYGNVTLEAGRYEAVIINLGSGTGDNWWCVAYPPLCFGADEYEYRSYFKDLWNSRR